MIKKSNPSFVFVKNPVHEAEALRSRGVFVCDMPEGINSVSRLHEALSEGLHFPDYYGNNWNALDEMLSDLRWLTAEEIAIVHAEIPGLMREDLALYLRILAEASNEAWAASRKYLKCVLPVDNGWVRELLTTAIKGLPQVN